MSSTTNTLSKDPWADQRGKYPDLVKPSELLALTITAYERHYQPGHRWVDLNPQVANHFLQIVKAVREVTR
jgi:hypothetical protein